MDKPTTVSDNPRVLFASTHCLLDFASGAAVATALTLETLAGQGFQCHAYCASHFDAPQETPLEQVLAGAGRTSAVRGGPGGRQIMETALGARGWVPVSIFKTASSRGWQSAVEPRTFLDVYSAMLDMVRPQLLLTYGGDPAGREMVRLAKARGCTVVFLLHNLAYGKRETFAGVDHVVVPTEFARRHYQERLGLVSHVLPCIVDPERVENRKISNLKSEISNKSEIQEQRNSKPSPHPNPLPEGEGTMCPLPGPLPEGKGTMRPHASPLPQGEGTKNVTFVNPEPAKGLTVFARIAATLAARRPDIRLLAVEGRSGGGWQRSLAEPGLQYVSFPERILPVERHRFGAAEQALGRDCQAVFDEHSRPGTLPSASSRP